jgi:hypothetical protein
VAGAKKNQKGFELNPRTRNGFGFPANTKKSSKVLTQHNALPANTLT